MGRGYWALCFRTVSSPPQNGFVTEKEVPASHVCLSHVACDVTRASYNYYPAYRGARFLRFLVVGAWENDRSAWGRPLFAGRSLDRPAQREFAILNAFVIGANSAFNFASTARTEIWLAVGGSAKSSPHLDAVAPPSKTAAAKSAGSGPQVAPD
jgi:hypothetical protein